MNLFISKQYRAIHFWGKHWKVYFSLTPRRINSWHYLYGSHYGWVNCWWKELPKSFDLDIAKVISISWDADHQYVMLPDKKNT